MGIVGSYTPSCFPIQIIDDILGLYFGLRRGSRRNVVTVVPSYFSDRLEKETECGEATGSH
jgi:hypothetical protein